MNTGANGQQPARCPVCDRGILRAERRRELFDYLGDRGSVSVVAENVPVEVCNSCSEVISGREAGRIRDDAICRALGLLTPSAVRSLREQLQLDIPELAALTGIDENLLHDIEAGRQIQSRAIDRFFRVLDKDPNAIAHLASVP